MSTFENSQVAKQGDSADEPTSAVTSPTRTNLNAGKRSVKARAAKKTLRRKRKSVKKTIRQAAKSVRRVKRVPLVAKRRAKAKKRVLKTSRAKAQTTRRKARSGAARRKR